MLLLTIISITKDDPNGIKKTIESTRTLRKYPGVKQIIIDSSSDETKTAIKSLAEGNENIEHIWQEPSGRSTAFNLGLNLAESEWIWFLNGGDEVHSHFAADNFLYLLNESVADAIIFQNEWKGTGRVAKHPPMWAMWPPLNPWIPHPSTLTRKSLYLKHGDFDETFEIAMDYEFWIRCLSKDTVVDTISIPITKYDITGISSTQTSKVAREAVRVITLHRWMLIKTWLKNGLIILNAWRSFSKESN